RVPQVDGPARSPNGLPSASHPSLPPATHPSLPVPQHAVPAPQPSPARSTAVTVGRTEGTSDAINSDLDDSDSEQEDGVDQEGTVKDIVFCTYDKVARVKNKWKCVLKDGMIHVNGKDYLFSKCTGSVSPFSHTSFHAHRLFGSEFEW
ncbi:TFIIA-domain-containing protein, partial [Exidia glandulosa HHB12029]